MLSFQAESNNKQCAHIHTCTYTFNEVCNMKGVTKGECLFYSYFMMIAVHQFIVFISIEIRCIMYFSVNRLVMNDETYKW